MDTRAIVPSLSGAGLPDNNNDHTVDEAAGPFEVEPILVCVRKRPLLEHEVRRGEVEAVGCNGVRPTGVVAHMGVDDAHTRRMEHLPGTEGLVTAFQYGTKLDGITPVAVPHRFQFDHAFGEFHSNHDVYSQALRAQVLAVLAGQYKTVTAFAYGQTGSGKTFTMEGLQRCVAAEVFHRLQADDSHAVEDGDGRVRRPVVEVSMFELLGNTSRDLLNNRNEVHIREDVDGHVHVKELTTVQVSSATHLLEVVSRGSALRATAATGRNQTSSRTHAVCRVTVRYPKSVALMTADMAKARRIFSKRVLGCRAGAFKPPSDETLRHITLVDLAGSERNRDSSTHDAARRKECTAINKSLMTLKECIRFRAMPDFEKKFEADHRTVVIATVSPLSSDHSHSVNTLRYADRIKERAVMEAKKKPRVNNPAKWSKQKVARWLENECCLVSLGNWSNVSGKKLCHMTETEMSYRCSRHAPHLYSLLHRLIKAAKRKERQLSDSMHDTASSTPTSTSTSTSTPARSSRSPKPRRKWTPPGWDSSTSRQRSSGGGGTGSGAQATVAGASASTRLGGSVRQGGSRTTLVRAVRSVRSTGRGRGVAARPPHQGVYAQ